VTAPARITTLIVDDDSVFAEEFAELLKGSGFQTEIADSLEQLDSALAVRTFDIVVLDQFLNGLNVLPRLLHVRERHAGGLVMLTNNADEIDRVIGLELGADDFIQKLQKPREIVARLRAVVRRTGSDNRLTRSDPSPLPWPVQGAEPDARLAGWQLDLAKRVVIAPNNQILKLTMTEFELVHLAASRHGQPIDRNQFYLTILGRSHAGPEDRSLDNIVSRIRRAFAVYLLEDIPVFRSVRGRGYCYVGPTLETVGSK
jgi:two-component system OmpR family response regulator